MSPQKSMNFQGWLVMGALAFIWGGSFLCFSLALRELEVFTIVALRVLIGSITLAIVILIVSKKYPLCAFPTGTKIWGSLMVMGLLNNVIPFSLIIWAQTHIESGLAGIFNATTAFFGILLAAIFYSDERLTVNKALGVTLGFAGVCVIIGWQALEKLDLRSVAQLALLGSSFSYGLAKVWSRKHLSDLHPISAAIGMLTCSSLIIVPVALYLHGLPNANLTPATYGAMLFLGIPATAMAYLLYYKSIQLSGSGNSSLVTLLVAPFAVFWGAIILNETLPVSAYAGFALIAVGMIVIDGRLFARFSQARLK